MANYIVLAKLTAEGAKTLKDGPQRLAKATEVLALPKERGLPQPTPLWDSTTTSSWSRALRTRPRLPSASPLWA